MIYMQDEYPDGWCIYDGDDCLFSGLEEDTACIVVSKMNAKQAEIDTLRAENTRLREALTLLVEAGEFVRAIWDTPMPYDAATTRVVFRQRLVAARKLLDADNKRGTNETPTA